jgi:hypothetical protein
MIECRAPSFIASEGKPGSGASPKSHARSPEGGVETPAGEALGRGAKVAVDFDVAVMVGVGVASAVAVGCDGVRVSSGTSVVGVEGLGVRADEVGVLVGTVW